MTNTYDYIPALLWKKKKITKSIACFMMEIPVVLYSKDGYPDIKKKVLPQPVFSTKEIEQLQGRATQAITNRMSADISIYHLISFTEVFTAIAGVMHDSDLYIGIRENKLYLHIRFPLKCTLNDDIFGKYIRRILDESNVSQAHTLSST